MRDRRRDESVIGVKNEGVVMSAHGAGSGFEWMRWRWRRNRRWRGSIRSSRQNGISGDCGRGGVGGGGLTAVPL